MRFPTNVTEFLPVVIKNVSAHWRGEEIDVPEILTKSRLRIVSLVAGPPGAYQP